MKILRSIYTLHEQYFEYFKKYHGLTKSLNTKNIKLSMIDFEYIKADPELLKHFKNSEEADESKDTVTINCKITNNLEYLVPEKQLNVYNQAYTLNFSVIFSMPINLGFETVRFVLSAYNLTPYPVNYYYQNHLAFTLPANSPKIFNLFNPSTHRKVNAGIKNYQNFGLFRYEKDKHSRNKTIYKLLRNWSEKTPEDEFFFAVLSNYNMYKDCINEKFPRVKLACIDLGDETTVRDRHGSIIGVSGLLICD